MAKTQGSDDDARVWSAGPSPAPASEKSNGIQGDERCEREEGDGDDPQREVLASLRVLAANCHDRATAEATSMTESSPKPMSADESATPPAHSATTASMTL